VLDAEEGGSELGTEPVPEPSAPTLALSEPSDTEEAWWEDPGDVGPETDGPGLVSAPTVESSTEPEPEPEPQPRTEPESAVEEEGPENPWLEAATETATAPTPVLGPRASSEEEERPWWEDPDATESVAGAEEPWWAAPGDTESDVVPPTEPEGTARPDETETEPVTPPPFAVRAFEAAPEDEAGQDGEPDRSTEDSGTEDTGTGAARGGEPDTTGERTAFVAFGAPAAPAPSTPSTASMPSVAPASPEPPAVAPRPRQVPPPPGPRPETRPASTEPVAQAPTPSYGRPESVPRFAEQTRPTTPLAPPLERREPEPVDEWTYRNDLTGDGPEPRGSRIPAGVLTVAGIVLVVITLVLGGFVALRSFSGSGEEPVAQGEQDSGGQAQDQDGQQGGSTSVSEADLAPTGVEVSDESFSVSLTWTDNSGGDTPHAVVGGPVGTTPTTMANVESGADTVAISGLNTEVDYCFRVVAVQSADVLAPSGEVCTDRG
jgi:hypothetical protein